MPAAAPPTPTSTPSPPALSGLLFDAARGTHYAKPVWRGRLHAVWCALSVLAGVPLLVAARGPVETTAVSVYLTGLIGLFGTSAVYHRGEWSPAASRLLQRLDHTMIVVLIAGTATPVALLAVRGTAGSLLLALVWACALTVIALHLWRMQVPERLMGGAFIGLGVLSALGLPALWDTAGHAAGGLVVVGGVLYVGGAVGYHLRRPDPSPLVFGYHEVFHAWVCAAATCHFAAVALLVTSR